MSAFRCRQRVHRPTLEVLGALPERDWTGDVIARFAGRIKYSY